MTKTLVIGAREGNVLWDWVTQHSQGPKCTRDVRFPDAKTLDVVNTDSVGEYIHDKGPFDEIIYGAGMNRLEWIRDVFRSYQMRAAYEVNVFGLVDVVSAHHVYHDKFPSRVVAIVSDSSRTPMRGSIAYSSSKAALVGVLKNMARELAPETTVVGVSPGIIDDTPMTAYIDRAVPKFRGWSPGAAQNYEKTMIPMQRRATKQEVVDTVHFALTGPAYLSGSIIELTGGK